MAHASSVIQSIQLQGTIPLGPVHKLPTFDKKRHTLPTESNEYTQAFLARLIEDELSETLETRFKHLRESLSYKRKDISATYQSPNALIQTKDFDYELLYDLDPESPTIYRLNQRLLNLNNVNLLDVEEFNTHFTETFDAIVIELNEMLCIESIIDAFEGDESKTWAIDYPSDYTFCTVELAESEATVHFASHQLTIQFAKKQSPREIHQSYQQMCMQFSDIEVLAFLQ